MAADFFASPPSQETELLAKERKKLLLEAIGKLTERQRQWLSLWLSGMKTEAIAKKMEISKETIYKMKTKVLHKLEELITQAENCHPPPEELEGIRKK